MTDKTRARKVLLVINSLEGGGAERVMCTLASTLAENEKHWTVTLATLDRSEDIYPLSPRVARIRLGSGGRLHSGALALLQSMRQGRPDVILSFLARANCAAIVCSRLLRIPCIISERVHTTSHFSSGGFRDMRKMMVRHLYPLADRVVAVSEGVGDDLVRNYGVSAGRVVTIHNPIDLDRIEQAAHAEPSIVLPPDCIVAVGRLVSNKNFSMLLRSYANANVGGALAILGEGPERSALTALAAKLGIADRVHMPGFAANPHAIVRQASFYVSASNAEGFPNAMLEAMCVGRPVVATDCDSGPSEILQDRAGTGKVSTPTEAAYGILVPTNDEHAMSIGLRVMANPEVCARFAAAARRRARDFGLEHAIARYETAIHSALTTSRFGDRHLQEN
jgi:N-acetylgalactosamine-N,N'-diacetylbacillosaminyl-diphospho-undecaprenol 4-alpha-N-acetylgalactosaminyltransferase